MSTTLTYGFQGVLNQVARRLPDGIIPGASKNEAVPWVTIVNPLSKKPTTVSHLTAIVNEKKWSMNASYGW